VKKQLWKRGNGYVFIKHHLKKLLRKGEERVGKGYERVGERR
jgi:hypothetical protein